MKRGHNRKDPEFKGTNQFSLSQEPNLNITLHVYLHYACISIAMTVLADIEIYSVYFARAIPELSISTNHMMEMIYGRLPHLLSRYNHNLLSPQKLLQKDPNYREETSKTSCTSCCFKTPANCFGATSVSSLTSMCKRPGATSE